MEMTIFRIIYLSHVSRYARFRQLYHSPFHHLVHNRDDVALIKGVFLCGCRFIPTSLAPSLIGLVGWGSIPSFGLGFSSVD